MTANEDLRALIVKRVRTDGRQVRSVCREVGISPPTVYKWLKRYDENANMTLADRSRRPRNSPNATTLALQSRICALHYDMGLSLSQIRLKLLEEHGSSPAHSTIHRIVHAHKPKQTIPASPSLVPSPAEQLLSILLGATPPGSIPFDLEITTSLIELVLLSGLGGQAAEVARLVRSSRQSVGRYWRDFQTTKLQTVWNPARTSPKVNKQSVREDVFRVLHSPPASFGFNRTSWRLGDISEVLRKQGSPVSEETISRIISSAGFQWKKARRVLTSRDPEYRQKLERIQQILSGLKRDEGFFSIDEFGPFAVKIRGGRRLVAPGEHPTYPQVQRSKGTLLFIAALELSTDQVSHFYIEKKNTAAVIDLLQELLNAYRGLNTIYLSWDTASWHMSRDLIAKVWEVNEADYRRDHSTPHVELVPLPSGAQFLNVIESVFSGLSRAIIHNSDYESAEVAKGAIDRYFVERNQHFREFPRRAGNKIWGKERVESSFSDSHNCKDPRW